MTLKILKLSNILELQSLISLWEGKFYPTNQVDLMKSLRKKSLQLKRKKENQQK